MREIKRDKGKVAKVDDSDFEELNKFRWFSNKDHNQKNNLRKTTQSQNMMNRPRLQVNNKSGFRGVAWHKRDRQWAAQIKRYGKRTYLEYFDLTEDAARAYDAKAREIFGEYCGKLNFEEGV